MCATEALAADKIGNIFPRKIDTDNVTNVNYACIQTNERDTLESLINLCNDSA